MRYNVNFTTYRRELASGKRQYAAGATLTAGLGFKTPVDGRLQASLGYDASLEMFFLLTEHTDFERHDKVVIDSVDFYIENIETIDTGAQVHTRLLIKRKNG